MTSTLETDGGQKAAGAIENRLTQKVPYKSGLIKAFYFRYQLFSYLFWLFSPGDQLVASALGMCSPGTLRRAMLEFG
jgi:hypothetical protein